MKALVASQSPDPVPAPEPELENEVLHIVVHCYALLCTAVTPKKAKVSDESNRLDSKLAAIS